MLFDLADSGCIIGILVILMMLGVIVKILFTED